MAWHVWYSHYMSILMKAYLSIESRGHCPVDFLLRIDRGAK